MNGIAEPVFDSAHAALTFAFLFSHQQYGRSPLVKLNDRAIGSGKGLVGFDGAAQAGMVLAEIERMERMERAVLVARYAQRVEPCPCCGADRPTVVWREAVEALATWCVPSGQSSLQVRRELVGKFFGIRVEFVALAERYGMNRKTVADHFAFICRRLREVEGSAQRNVDGVLRMAGMVGEGWV